MVWETLLVGVHLVVAAALIGFVLLQHGKGADMGAAFGSGSSGSLFGAAGSANFLSRTTAVLATAFFLSSLGLTYFGATRTRAWGHYEAGCDAKRAGTGRKEGKATDVPQGSRAGDPARAPARDSDSKPIDVPK